MTSILSQVFLLYVWYYFKVEEVLQTTFGTLIPYGSASMTPFVNPFNPCVSTVGQKNEKSFMYILDESWVKISVLANLTRPGKMSNFFEDPYSNIF